MDPLPVRILATGDYVVGELALFINLYYLYYLYHMFYFTKTQKWQQ